MSALFDPGLDYDDVPADVRAEDAQERRRARWTCICGGGVGCHQMYCPEGDPEWAKEDDDE